MKAENTGVTILKNAGWTVTPFNYPVGVIPPPQVSVRLRGAVGEFFFGRLVLSPQPEEVDSEIHRALLDESFQKYGYVWRKLAVR